MYPSFAEFQPDIGGAFQNTDAEVEDISDTVNRSTETVGSMKYDLTQIQNIIAKTFLFSGEVDDLASFTHTNIVFSYNRDRE